MWRTASTEIHCGRFVIIQRTEGNILFEQRSREGLFDNVATQSKINSSLINNSLQGQCPVRSK